MTEIQKKTVQAIVNVFETGSPEGQYSAIAVLAGDSGGLSYGRSQVTRASGNLYLLLQDYCAAREEWHGCELAAFLERAQRCDPSLDQDSAFRLALLRAGADPGMHATQDAFFDRAFFNPACAAAASCRLVSSLAHAVVYDSFIQGGWSSLRKKVMQAAGSVSARLGEREWIRAYLDARRKWLSSLPEPLPRTVCRVDALRGLVERNNWELELPLEVRGVKIEESALGLVLAT